MSARDEPIHRGTEKGRTAWNAYRREIRQARLSLGKSQALAARQAGIDPATWNRIENDRQRAIDLELAGRMAGVVGLDLTLSLYPAPRLLIDAPQLELWADTRYVFGPPWGWRSEVHVGDAHDQRAWDLQGIHRQTHLKVCIDAECVFRDCQAVMRRVEGKRMADGQPRVILVIRDSRANRRAVEEARETLKTAFPIDGRAGLAALRRGEDPGGDVLLMVDWHRTERLAMDRARAAAKVGAAR
ncbi:MAG: helix-turn-helix transcriptional regulator [Chloroflexota bacterium]